MIAICTTGPFVCLRVQWGGCRRNVLPIERQQCHAGRVKQLSLTYNKIVKHQATGHDSRHDSRLWDDSPRVTSTWSIIGTLTLATDLKADERRSLLQVNPLFHQP